MSDLTHMSREQHHGYPRLTSYVNFMYFVGAPIASVFQVSSPNYPGHYADNTDRTYILFAGVSANASLSLTIDAFETEHQYDILTVYDGLEERQRARWVLSVRTLKEHLAPDSSRLASAVPPAIPAHTPRAAQS